MDVQQQHWNGDADDEEALDAPKRNDDDDAVLTPRDSCGGLHLPALRRRGCQPRAPRGPGPTGSLPRTAFWPRGRRDVDFGLHTVERERISRPTPPATPKNHNVVSCGTLLVTVCPTATSHREERDVCCRSQTRSAFDDNGALPWPHDHEGGRRADVDHAEQDFIIFCRVDPEQQQGWRVVAILGNITAIREMVPSSSSSRPGGTCSSHWCTSEGLAETGFTKAEINMNDIASE